MTIEQTDIYQQLRSLLSEEFEIDADDISPESNLFEDLDIDSIDAIDMLTRLRSLTGKDLPADELKTVRTIADVVTLVEAS